MDFLRHLISANLWASLTVSLLTCLLALAIAPLARAEAGQSWHKIGLNLRYLVFHVVLRHLAAPVTTLLMAWPVALWGGSLITLPDHGWGLLWAIPAYVLTMDVAEYAFHRAQHRFSILWSMHSLHHSDTALNASTTERHFWLEFIIKAALIYPPVILLFAVNPVVVGVYALLSLWNFFVHANLKLSLGKFWPCLNMPHYHRLHHSAEPRYFNANYAALFPAIDWLCGTAKPGAPDEYPATGLDTGIVPQTFLDAFLWPWRQQHLQPGHMRQVTLGTKPSLDEHPAKT